tara:strand:+ start:25 stop:273 length:249 start_codon:yes stop_codon:yes gene_type:complete
MLDKYDKEILFKYLWKTINFFYGIMILLSILVGIRTLLYLLGGIPEEETSISGTIIVIALIVVYVLFRNLTKPYFMKKINKS